MGNAHRAKGANFPTSETIATYPVQSSLQSSLRSPLRVRHWSIVKSKAIPAIIEIITITFSMIRLLCFFPCLTYIGNDCRFD